MSDGALFSSGSEASFPLDLESKMIQNSIVSSDTLNSHAANSGNNAHTNLNDAATSTPPLSNVGKKRKHRKSNINIKDDDRDDSALPDLVTQGKVHKRTDLLLW